jgi:hypothetical protein
VITDCLGTVRRIIIEFDGQRSGGMSDWIDELKRKEEEKNRNVQQHREWQIRCDGIISSRGPVLLTELIVRMRSDIARLKEKFPTDDSKHIQIDEVGDMSIYLTRPTFPYTELRLRWIPDERLIGVHLDGSQYVTTEPVSERLLRRMLI